MENMCRIIFLKNIPKRSPQSVYIVVPVFMLCTCICTVVYVVHAWGVHTSTVNVKCCCGVPDFRTLDRMYVEAPCPFWDRAPVFGDKLLGIRGIYMFMYSSAILKGLKIQEPTINTSTV